MKPAKLRRLRIPRLTRSQRLARNVLLLVMVLALFWCSPAAELLFPVAGFRRLERRLMQKPSELLAVLERDNSAGVRFVGKTADAFVLCEGHSDHLYNLEYVPMEPGTQLIAAYGPSDIRLTAMNLFCWDGGSGPETATLSLYLSSEALDFDEVYTATAQRKKSGCFVFQLETRYDYFSDSVWTEGQRYNEYAVFVTYAGLNVVSDGERICVEDLESSFTVTYS